MTPLEQAKMAAQKVEALRRKAETTPIFRLQPIIQAMGREQSIFNTLIIGIIENGKP